MDFCACGGRNENCFRCDGRGYLGRRIITRSPVPTRKPDAPPRQQHLGKKSESPRAQEPKTASPIVKCPFCSGPVSRRNLEKHVAKQHLGNKSESPGTQEPKTASPVLRYSGSVPQQHVAEKAVSTRTPKGARRIVAARSSKVYVPPPRESHTRLRGDHQAPLEEFNEQEERRLDGSKWRRPLVRQVGGAWESSPSYDDYSEEARP